MWRREPRTVVQNHKFGNMLRIGRAAGPGSRPKGWLKE